jgi:hypothetical protein
MRYREILEACWSGYQQQGMKKKGDRMVPNCVSINEDQEKFILYFNGRPVAQYNTEQEAEYQGQLIQKRVPGTEYEIKKEVCTLTTVELKENLRNWFKEKWVRFGPDGKIRGDCARGSSKEGKPKCLPQSKAQALGKKGRAASAAKKRRQDPNANRRGAAKNVATKVKEEQLDELQFLGSECTKDCSGHRAGYNWSRAQGGVDGMSPWSPSFNKGAALAKAGK